ncbi:GGDEF domain-containing protein, partial [Thermodesulfobacteriota bacterium]
DRLTGIANRFRLDEVLLQEVERAGRYETPLSLMIMDIDFFKRVNDNHGHQAGDAVLQEFARLLDSNIRKSDTLGRWGGEEFLIICPGIGLEGAAQVAEKLRSRIAKHQFGPASDQTASFGVAQYLAGETPEDLVRCADQALYRAKDNGRNRVEVS